jgi:hypothetical protein
MWAFILREKLKIHVFEMKIFVPKSKELVGTLRYHMMRNFITYIGHLGML